MPYLNLDIGYFSHRKTKRLVQMLGPGADVLPLKLWCYCALHHEEDGRITDYKPKEIEELIEWKGEPERAWGALIDLGFIDTADGGELYVHDWQEHEGHLVAFKRRSKKANDARWGKIDPDAPKKEGLDFSLGKWPAMLAHVKAWEEWVGYRKKKKPYETQRGVDAALKLLSSQPDPSACIQQSIDNEWRGLFALRQNGKTVKSDGFQYERLG